MRFTPTDAAVLTDVIRGGCVALLLGIPGYAVHRCVVHLRARRRRASQIARLVADHWRRTAVDWGNQLMPGRVAAHPLCCVLAALDGESDPDQLGVGAGPEREAILALGAGGRR